MFSDLISIEQPSDDVCLFWFSAPEPYVTSVAAVQRGEHCLVIDSFCGSYYMDPIRQELQKHFSPKRFSLLNTHSHYDHICGNYSFVDCPIYSSSLCKEQILRSWETQLEEDDAVFRGVKQMVLPNILVDEALEILPDLFLLPTPGHTADSICLWDKKNRFLFAGDMVERPVVQLCNRNLNAYRHSIAQLQLLQPQAVFSGHCLDHDPCILQETADYLKALAEQKALSFDDPTAQFTHEANRKLLNLP